MMRLYLTGRLAVEADGEVLLRERSFRARQERLAFAYLALTRARPVPRTELAILLWPDGAPPAWTTALSAVVSRLRALLARHERLAACASISGDSGQYQLHLPADAWIDVEAAVSSLDAAEGVLRNGRAPRDAFGAAWVAATIAERPFLSDVEVSWAQRERERLARVRLRALECLAQVWIASGEAALAVEAASDALDLDPYRESAYRLLMQAHGLAGNPAQAVRAYHTLRERLISELGTDPSPETEAVYLGLLG